MCLICHGCCRDRIVQCCWPISARRLSKSRSRGYWHLQLNRNKKSVVLNLKSEAGCRAFLELVKTADVVVESYRPGVLTKLGIDYAAAKAVNTRIIYCSLTG